MTRHDTLFEIDITQVKEKVIKGFADGSAYIANGVARKVKGNAILQHLPFRPLENTREAGLPRAMERLPLHACVPLQAEKLQRFVAVATAASIGTTIVCTAYLAHRIAELEAKLQQLGRAVESLGRMFLADRFAAYTGATRGLLVYLASPAVARENPDLVSASLSKLTQERHQILAFVGHLNSSFDELEGRMQSLVHEFMLGVLDFYPRALVVESRAAYSLERFQLGHQIRSDAKAYYLERTDAYRTWGNARLRRIIACNGTKGDSIFAAQLGHAREVIHSPINAMLLGHSS